MRISFHGGLCCGIKHIHELGSNPSGKLGALKARVYEGPEWTHDRQKNTDQWGINVNSATNCFDQEAPAETYLERLDRYLKFLDDWRPNGIIEIVLCDYSNSSDPETYGQIDSWEGLLFKRGFELVSNCYNSNSGNRIFVYHRTTDKEDD